MAIRALVVASVLLLSMLTSETIVQVNSCTGWRRKGPKPVRRIDCSNGSSRERQLRDVFLANLEDSLSAVVLSNSRLEELGAQQ
jgi:hypothetical protein